MEPSDEKFNQFKKRSDSPSHLVGLSLTLALSSSCLLTLFGIALLEATTQYRLGPTRFLILAGIFVLLNVCFMALVGWAISRAKGS